MGRRRSAKTRSLPPNLYERRGYFAWRDPRNGKEYGLGRDRRSAVSQAIEANHEVVGTTGKRALVDRINTGKDDSMSAWCDEYLKILNGRKLKPTSMTVFTSRLKTVRKAWPDMRIDAITTRHVAEFLDGWEDRGKKRMASAMRSFLLDVFNAAQSKGWISSNPVTPTKAPDVSVNRSRLTLEGFQAIHAAAIEHQPAWVARSMELALVTGQRREDISKMGPKNLRDGSLWIVQSKTGAKVRIPLTLRLNVVGWSVGDVIARCRDKVLSPHFIHHESKAGGVKTGDAIPLSSISSAFAEARKRSGIAWEDGKTHPTFHEIRSLAARLYSAQGTDAQALLGHKSAQTTAMYRDARGAEWVEVQAR